MKTNHSEEFVGKLSNNHRFGTSQFILSIISSQLPLRDLIMLSNQEENPFFQNLNTPKFKELRIDLLKKFDNICSKFSRVVNKIQLINFFLFQRYSIYKSQVDLIGTLFMEKVLTWFTLLFEKILPILNYFELF